MAGSVEQPAAFDLLTNAVADWRNDRVQYFTPYGELLYVFGTLGSDKTPLKRRTAIFKEFTRAARWETFASLSASFGETAYLPVD